MIEPLDAESGSRYLEELKRYLNARDFQRQQDALNVFDAFCNYDFENPNLAYVWNESLGRRKICDPAGEELDGKIKTLLNRHTIAYFLDLVFADVESARQSERAIKRHAETRSMKMDVFQWLEENMHKFKSMDKAAEAVIKQQPIAFRTARDWVGEWKKLRSTGKP